MGDGDVHPALSKQFQLVASVSRTMVESDQHPPQTERVARPQLCQSSWLAMHHVSCDPETLDKLSSYTMSTQESVSSEELRRFQLKTSGDD